jgi:ribose 5-phosphate isomerase B
MRFAFASDDTTELADTVVSHLRRAGHDVEVLALPAPWPDAGMMVGEAVSGGRADMGVVCCWTGTGVSMAANKVKGVRAALCTDAETARGARKWNDANVLALSIRLTSGPLACEILDAFTSTGPDPAEAAEIGKLP